MQQATENDLVFVNCPFDKQYLPILRAIVFTIYRCGFLPKSALEEDNGLENRLDKINRLIEQCRYGIHDISRTQLSKHRKPRFNMPFELGIFFGAKRFGDKDQKLKNALILEKTKFSYQLYISDLNGVDTKAHNNNPHDAIEKVRDWLRTASRRSSIPGSITITEEYDAFNKSLPKIVKQLGVTLSSITFSEFCTLAEENIYIRSRIHEKLISLPVVQ